MRVATPAKKSPKQKLTTFALSENPWALSSSTNWICVRPKFETEAHISKREVRHPIWTRGEMWTIRLEEIRFVSAGSTSAHLASAEVCGALPTSEVAQAVQTAIKAATRNAKPER